MELPFKYYLRLKNIVQAAKRELRETNDGIIISHVISGYGFNFCGEDACNLLQY